MKKLFLTLVIMLSLGIPARGWWGPSADMISVETNNLTQVEYTNLHSAQDAFEVIDDTFSNVYTQISNTAPYLLRSGAVYRADSWSIDFTNNFLSLFYSRDIADRDVLSVDTNWYRGIQSTKLSNICEAIATFLDTESNRLTETQEAFSNDVVNINSNVSTVVSNVASISNDVDNLEITVYQPVGIYYSYQYAYELADTVFGGTNNPVPIDGTDYSIKQGIFSNADIRPVPAIVSTRYTNINAAIMIPTTGYYQAYFKFNIYKGDTAVREAPPRLILVQDDSISAEIIGAGAVRRDNSNNRYLAGAGAFAYFKVDSTNAEICAVTKPNGNCDNVQYGAIIFAVRRIGANE